MTDPQAGASAPAWHRRDWVERLTGDRLYLRTPTYADVAAWAVMGSIVGYVFGAR